MRFLFRVCAVVGLSILLGTPAFGDSGAEPKAKAKKATTETVATPAEKAAAGASAPASPATKPSAPAARGARGAGSRDGTREAPTWTPVPATSGGLGLFTVETGETLPHGGVSFSAGVNKFERQPGSVSVLNLGWNFGVGLTNWLTLYAQWDPFRHTHIGAPGELSLNSPISNPPFPNATNPTIYRSLTNVPGTRPGYVEDYPFAFRNDGGVGEFVLGVKLAFLSEKRGDPVSLSVRNDFIFPTRTQLTDLLDNGTQSGQFNDLISVALSKTWGSFMTLTGNWGYRFTRDPRSAGRRALEQADQMRVGAGLLLFPEKRFQPMTEYTGVIFLGSATPNTTFGARDPVDGVWGFRFYPWRSIAVDIGYRYMLNLRDKGDRHGFVVKLGGAYWPEKIPENHSPVAACSADKNSVYAESGESVNVRAQASDPDNDPLTYTWTASGGRVEGTGAEVRWNSTGTAPGTYTVTTRVDDGRGGTASCSVDIRVEPRPNRPPVITCSADRATVLVGERVRIAADASDPDNDPLTYSWRTNGGQIIGSGATVQLDTSGLSAGRYSVAGRVEDGRGGAADCNVDVNVQAPPPPPQASKLNECFFALRSPRVDNVCKRVLDDVALRLKNEPRATVVIVGYADPKEPKPDKLAGLRGENAASYVASKGVERSRINTRTAGGQAGAGEQNRRIDIIWVPEGATY